MEGSSSGPAATSLHPSLMQAPNGAGPMAQVPIGGGPPNMGIGTVQGAAPGPAAFAMPPQSMPQQMQQPMMQQPVQQFNPMPPNVAELNAPAESVLLTEMQELKDAAKKVIAFNRLAAMALFCIGLTVIYYMSSKIKARVVPDAG